MQTRLNAIWIEATGCSGNMISLLDASNPDILYFLNDMINLKYNNSIMAKQGENAFEDFMNTLDTEFILLVDGALSNKDDGKYTIIANYKGRDITAAQAVQMAAAKAKYIVAVGTCAAFGGISGATGNASDSMSLSEFLGTKVINLPGCPCNPVWLIGTVAHIINYGMPELDSSMRPTLFYGKTIHRICPRRSYFDKGIFATELGQETCMFKLGCKGPVTYTNCPEVKWNCRINWPIGNNTPCIGCASNKFPDGMEPFVKS